MELHTCTLRPSTACIATRPQTCAKRSLRPKSSSLHNSMDRLKMAKERKPRLSLLPSTSTMFLSIKAVVISKHQKGPKRPSQARAQRIATASPVRPSSNLSWTRSSRWFNQAVETLNRRFLHSLASPEKCSKTNHRMIAGSPPGLTPRWLLSFHELTSLLVRRAQLPTLTSITWSLRVVNQEIATLIWLSKNRLSRSNLKANKRNKMKKAGASRLRQWATGMPWLNSTRPRTTICIRLRRTRTSGSSKSTPLTRSQPAFCRRLNNARITSRWCKIELKWHLNKVSIAEITEGTHLNNSRERARANRNKTK